MAYKQKYRRLSKDELSALDKEFIHFLVVHGYAGDDWEKMKAQNPDLAEELICTFSDFILENILQKARYLDFISTKRMLFFDFQKDVARCIAIHVDEKSTFELPVKDFSSLLKMLDNEEININIANKKLDDLRSAYLFQELEKGCSISDGSCYRALAGLILPEFEFHQN